VTRVVACGFARPSALSHSAASGENESRDSGRQYDWSLRCRVPEMTSHCVAPPAGINTTGACGAGQAIFFRSSVTDVVQSTRV